MYKYKAIFTTVSKDANNVVNYTTSDFMLEGDEVDKLIVDVKENLSRGVSTYASIIDNNKGVEVVRVRNNGLVTNILSADVSGKVLELFKKLLEVGNYNYTSSYWVEITGDSYGDAYFTYSLGEKTSKIFKQDVLDILYNIVGLLQQYVDGRTIYSIKAYTKNLKQGKSRLQWLESNEEPGSVDFIM